MSMIKEPELALRELVLGDYVTVHGSNLKPNLVNNTGPCDMQVHREEFIQRIEKQRGEFLRRMQKQKGKLLDVRQNGTAWQTTAASAK